jgi:uncharacterized protein (DUF488 family)
MHQIELLADVRSQPFSRLYPWFSQDQLRAWLGEAGLEYAFLGRELGGRPASGELLDDEGHALYHRMADSPLFRAGLDKLAQSMQASRVAIMCSEEDPTVCHRHLLITRVLRQQQIDIQHIRGDGRLESEDQLRPRRQQGMLFAEMEQDRWKSLRSVSPKPRPPSSSES